MDKFKKLLLNQKFILVLIVINAVTIFIEEFGEYPRILDYLEALFTLLFICEAVVKISTWGAKKYFSDAWNIMDFVLVLIALPSLALLFGQNATWEHTNVFLTLRVLRVFKSFRLIRFMPDVDNFIASVKRALRASYIILFGFFILIFITALISCSLFKGVAPEYFDNPLTSIYSIFRLFSIEGWYEIPDLIAERTSPMVAFWTKAFFSALLLIGGILGLSLVNSIFVDAMVADNTDELEDETRQLKDKIDSLEKKIDELLKRKD